MLYKQPDTEFVKIYILKPTKNQKNKPS